MNKLNIQAINIEGKSTEEIVALVSKYPFYEADKEANAKKKNRFVFSADNLSGEMLSNIYLTDEIILGIQFSDSFGDDLQMHFLERELQFVDVYEFPLLEGHKLIPFIEDVIAKKPLQFHWRNTNRLHEKYAHPFFKNVLGFRNTDFMIHPKDVGLTFPYQHPDFKNVKEDILIIQNLYFKKSHLIAYKVFNPKAYEFKTVWSMEFFEYLKNVASIKF